MVEITGANSDGRDTANQILLLSTLGKVRASGDHIGKTLLTKVFFLAENKLSKKDSIGLPSYKFFRHQYGPFSKDLYEDLGLLSNSRLVTAHGSRATRAGRELALFLSERLKEDDTWRHVIDTLDKTYEKYRGWSAVDIEERVYKMKIRPLHGEKKQSIKEIANFTDLIDPAQNNDLSVAPIPQDVREAYQYALSVTEEDLLSMKNGPFISLDSFLDNHSAA